MARSQNTLIGRASGSVGEVTFLTWKAVNVIRAKMSHQTNPNSPSQAAQRFKYNFILSFYQAHKEFINIGLKGSNRKMTIYNLFQNQNLKSIFINNFPSLPIVDYSKIQISKGLLNKPIISSMGISPPPFGVFANIPAGQKIDASHVYWLYVIGYNWTNGQWESHNLQYFNSFTQVYFEFADFPDPTDNLATYAFFVNRTTGEISDTTSFIRQV